MKPLTDYWSKGYPFARYLENFEHESVSVLENNPYYGYIRLNWSRTRRLLKQVTLFHNFKDIDLSNIRALVITEHWCGDAAQNLPAIHKILQACGISMRLVYRDKNPELMERYLTKGTRSIPKVVLFDANNREIWVWGPRPEPAQNLMHTLKEDHRRTKEEKDIELQRWYIADAGKTVQSEFFTALSSF